MRAAPFARAQALFTAIQGLLSQFSGLKLHNAIAALGPYRSRGKGKKHRAGKAYHGGNNAGRGVPHQGPQECARRARQARYVSLKQFYQADGASQTTARKAALAMLDSGQVPT